MAIEFRVERGWSFFGYQAWILDYRDGKTHIAKPMEMEFVPVEEAAQLPEPSLKISHQLAIEFIPKLKKALAGITWPNDKEDYEVQKRVESAMQSHIDSLKLVVDRIVK